MHWTDQVEAVSAALTLGATVVGFLFVAAQLRLVRHSLRSDANSRLSEQSLTILAYLGRPENVKLYPYFYDGQDLSADDVNRVPVWIACEMIANYSDMALCSVEDLERKERSQWEDFIRDTCRKSPAFAAFVRERSNWYSPALVRVVQAETAPAVRSR